MPKKPDLKKPYTPPPHDAWCPQCEEKTIGECPACGHEVRCWGPPPPAPNPWYERLTDVCVTIVAVSLALIMMGLIPWVFYHLVAYAVTHVW